MSFINRFFAKIQAPFKEIMIGSTMITGSYVLMDFMIKDNDRVNKLMEEKRRTADLLKH